MALLLFLAFPAFALDDDTDPGSTEELARQSHEKASSDFIYQNEEWKALYYQNQKIIQILKEIRDSLDVIKMRDSVKNNEEKKV